MLARVALSPVVLNQWRRTPKRTGNIYCNLFNIVAQHFLVIIVTSVEGLDLVGIVQDTYRHFLDGEIIYVENYESIRFPRASIIEVPLTWDDNENLKDIA